MNTIAQSALESAILDRFHQLYQAKGFPPADSISVLRRENTGGGRYTELECDAPLRMNDGHIDLGGSFIEMKDLPSGMMAVVLIKGGRVKTLEFTVYGGDFWDGEERAWKII